MSIFVVGLLGLYFQSAANGLDLARIQKDADSKNPAVRAALVAEMTEPIPHFDLPDDAVITYCGTGAEGDNKEQWTYVAKRCKAEILALLDDPKSDRRISLIDGLASCADHDLYLRLDGLCLSSESLVRSHARQAYQQYPGAHSTDQLVVGTRDLSAEVRIRSLTALGYVNPDLGVHIAIGMLNERVYNPERDFVAETVGGAKTESMLPELLPLLQSESERLRNAAEDALANIGTLRTSGMLAAVVRDQSSTDRVHALWLLRDIKTDESRAATIDCLDDQDPTIVNVACQVQTYQRDARAVPKLKALLRSSNAEIRKAARSALSSFESKLPPP